MHEQEYEYVEQHCLWSRGRSGLRNAHAGHVFGEFAAMIERKQARDTQNTLFSLPLVIPRGVSLKILVLGDSVYR